MLPRTFVAISLLLSAFSGAAAMDTSPYEVGQALTTDQARELNHRYAGRKIQHWKSAPDTATIIGREDADLINYGIQVLDRTSSTIGPLVKDKHKRFSGNNLNCSSCHIKGDDGLPGTKYFGIPFTNVSNDYPNFRARSMTVGSAADRVNGCMTRSMGFGHPLPIDSREMLGILAYYKWLSEGTEPGLAMEGVGLPKLELPARRANLDKGKSVYGQFCANCHGKDAAGNRSPQFERGAGYVFPPLAGDGSFDNGAGMSRLITAARFIYANMPFGATVDKPVLTVEQAYDVAGYIESMPRPERSGREHDFSNPEFRPIDYPVPAFYDGNKAALDKARYGPYR